jgi:hypothetical protein
VSGVFIAWSVSWNPECHRRESQILGTPVFSNVNRQATLALPVTNSFLKTVHHASLRRAAFVLLQVSFSKIFGIAAISPWLLHLGPVHVSPFPDRVI